MQIEENLALWDNYDWPQGGDEWSKDWGSPEAQWFGSLFPRIHSFLPAPSILEIAPGHGRWTGYLKDLTSKLILVDISPNCIEACRERFLGLSHIAGYVNDGKSLEMVPDGSVDFAFSFDSLVHAECDVIERYLEELSRKLTLDGVGFIHHSNIGQYAAQLASGEMVNLHNRAESMTAEKFASYCSQFNLVCIAQEMVNWGWDELNDCFSTFTRKDSRWARANQICHNRDFMAEAALLRKISPIYCDRVWPENAARRELLGLLT